MIEDTRIYLDHSATTPLHPEVFEAMEPYLRHEFGNAGSIHAFGRACRRAVDDAREQVAALIGAEPREIVFTAGGTEADNLAVLGVCRAENGGAPKHLIVSTVEHHAVLHAAETLAARGEVELDRLGVDSDGLVDPDALAAMLRDGTALVSVMHANNETGTVQPIEALAALCRERGVAYHTDAVQSIGKIPFDVRAIPVALASISSHKINGPKGVGACYVRHGFPLAPQTFGGAQERGKRAGTENVAGIVGFGKACQLALHDREALAAQTQTLRDQLEAGLIERVTGVHTNGARTQRLPHILNVAFDGIEGESLILALDMDGIAASTGSACTSGSIEPSHVLLAMGQDPARAQSAARFSFGRGNAPREVERLLAILPGLVERLRAVTR